MMFETIDEVIHTKIKTTCTLASRLWPLVPEIATNTSIYIHVYHFPLISSTMVNTIASFQSGHNVGSHIHRRLKRR